MLGAIAFRSEDVMPDALRSVKTRRSVKPMELGGPARAPPNSTRYLTIASRVPDHGKLTPWRFIVFEGDARDRRRRDDRRGIPRQ